jgi:two-component system NtrC family sensor kinase
MKGQHKTKQQLLTQVAELSQRVEELEAQLTNRSQANSTDIGERRRAEEALRKSEEFNRMLIQNSPIGVSVRGRTGRLLSYNPAWQKIWAMPDEAVLADLARERFKLEFDEKDEYLKPHLGELRRVYESGGSLHLPELCVAQPRPGGAQWVAQYFYAIQDDLGEIDRVVILTEDVTERKQAEEALRRYADEQTALYKTSLRLNAQLDLAELLRLVLDQAVALLEAEGGRLYLYDPQRDELTVSAGDGFMRESVGEILKPGEGLAGQAFASRRPQFVDTHNVCQGQAAVYKEDARLRAMLAVPLLGRQGALGVLDIAGSERKLTFDEHDIELAELFAAQAGVALENARLHAEARRHARELAALNMATQAVTSTLNLESVLELMITEARALVGAEGASVVLHSDTELVFAAAAGPGAEELVGMRMPITAGIAGWVVREGRAVRVDDVRGDPRFYTGIDKVTSLTTRSVLAVPLRVKDTIIGIVEAINKISPLGTTGRNDMFDEHDLELLQMMADSAAIAIENARLYQVEQDQLRRLQESQAQLVQSAKMAALGRLLASITHEINNPLQAIQSSLTLAQEEMEGSPRPEKIARYLSMAETEIERLTAIVRRLRDFYRPTHQERHLTDVRAVLESVLELTGKQLQHSHIAVEREDLGRLPLIWANADHLKQVFLNLVLNAIDAMSTPAADGARGGTLHVRTALDTCGPRGGPARPAVRIEFSDTGEGISPEVMSHLFEPFVTTKPDGTGLGLSISYGIIGAHDGQITVNSQAGKGTMFTIWLPVERTLHEESVQDQSPTFERAGSPASARC